LAQRLNWLDRAIGVVAPRAAYRRGVARAALDGVRAYDSAAVGRRTEGWRTGRTSADAEISRGLIISRNRSRDLSRNNPHARKAKSVWVNNLIGTGIIPRAHSGNDLVDGRADALFAQWAEVADAGGQLNFGGLQELMVNEMVEGGEVLIRKRLRLPEDNLPVPLQLEILEGDLLDESRTRDLGAAGTMVNGVEFDPIGRRRAYWLFSGHPGNAMLLPSANLISSPVPADQVLHLYRKERTQTRGMPWAASIVRRIRDLDDYEDAEITRKKIEACVVAIVVGADSSDGIAPTTREGLAVKDSHGNPIEQFEPGLIAYSNDARDIKFNNPGQSGSYPEYQKIGLHSVAAGYLVPYELLTGDLSEVNFSSARVGLVEFRRLVEAVQWLCIIPMALQPIWDWFVATAYLADLLPQRVIPCEWDTPAFESVNPIDDANAELISIRAGTTSLISAIARRTGRDPDVVLNEIAKTNKQLDELGLIFDSDPRKVARTGVEQPAQSAQSLRLDRIIEEWGLANIPQPPTGRVN
jgi:lambda family phage portal protein